MIKNLDDFMSLVALLILSYLGVSLLVGALIKKDDEKDENIKSRHHYFKDYLNNEDE